MINRNYLPYKSARDYIDRGMAKWQGFFISEHTHALQNMCDEIDISSGMNQEEILFLISQVYVENLKVKIHTHSKTYIGKICDMQNGKIYFITSPKNIWIPYEEIKKIIVREDV